VDKDLFEISEPIVYYKTSEIMEELEDDSVQLIVTSPPYGKIKDYGLDGQIGFSDSFDDYFKRLKSVWSECHRVLEPQCRMVINVGDQYLRTTDYGRYRILSIASKIIDDCIDLGFDFLGDIIWQKISTTNTTGGCSLMGSIYYPRNGLLTYDYEHILILKKHEGKAKKIPLEKKELSKISLSEWKKWYVGHWRFPGIVQKEHIAMFPEELPYRIIRMFSFVGDTILDPFLGSGTTLKITKSLYRKGIGYEINKEFKEVIEQKVKDAKSGYYQDYQYLIHEITQKLKENNIRFEYQKQKQKGIIILKNGEEGEIILDYFLIENEEFDKSIILKEFKSKSEENSLQNYLNQQEKWENFTNYIIVINSKLNNDVKFKELLNSFFSSIKTSKKIEVIPYDEIISKNYQISTLFE